MSILTGLHEWLAQWSAIRRHQEMFALCVQEPQPDEWGMQADNDNYPRGTHRLAKAPWLKGT